MLNDISRAQLVVAWSAAVAVLGALCILAGVAITVGNAQLWLMAGVVPPTVLLLVWSGSPSPHVAKLRYGVGKPLQEKRSS
jgi:hypothetical protein